MIEKITKIKNLGIFHDFTWESRDLEFKKTNLTYGFNGSGKTTLSNILTLFSNDVSDEEKSEILKRLKNNENEEFEIELFWDSNKVKTFSESKKIFVFNSNFVIDHVYNGSKAKIKKFKGGIVTSDQLKNPQINNLETKILEKEKRKDGIDREIQKLSELAKTIYKDLSSRWNRSITGYRLPVGLKLENAPQNADNKSVQETEDE